MRRLITPILFLVVAATALSNPVTVTLTPSATTGLPPLSITLAGLYSTTAGTISSWTFNLGNGVSCTGPSSDWNCGPNLNQGLAQVTYTTAGTYKPSLTVFDTKGNSNSATTTIVVGTCGPPLFTCANQSTTAYTQPSPPNAGGPSGAGNYFYDPVFHGIGVRLTDYTHTIIPGGRQFDGNSFQAGCGGGAACNASNTDDTLWKVEGLGGADYLLRLDPTAFALAVTKIRATNNTIPAGLPQSVFGIYTTTPTGYKIPKGRFSWKQKNLYYSSTGSLIQAYCFGTTYVGGVCSNTLDTVNTPSIANGRIVTLVDLTKAGPNCLSSTYVPTWSAFGGTDKASDSIFTVAFSSLNEGYPGQVNGDQNSGVHAVVWSAVKGCQVLNTYTGLFTADSGWGTNGLTMSILDRFTLHSFMNIDFSGTYVGLSMENCFTVCGNGFSGNFLTLGTNIVSYLCAPGYKHCSGHSAFGYKAWQNDPSGAFDGQDWVRPLPNTNGTGNASPLVKVSGITCFGDQHESWVADDPSNLTVWTATRSMSTESRPAKVCTTVEPYRNEISGYDPAGSNIRRFGFTWNSGYSDDFSTQFAIHEWGQTGTKLAWSSDWMETLGDGQGNATCVGGGGRYAGWNANEVLAAGTIIAPQNTAAYLFKVITPGTTGATKPSSWNQTVGGLTASGTVILQNIGSGCRGDVFLMDLTTAY